MVKYLWVRLPPFQGDDLEPSSEGNFSARSAPMRSAILRGPFSWCAPERSRTN